MNFAKYLPVILVPLLIWGLVYGGFSCDTNYAEKAVEAYKAQDFEAAEKYISKVVEAGSKDNIFMANIHVVRGECRRHLKRYEKALEDAEIAIRYGEPIKGHYLRGMAMAGMGREEDAISDFNIAIDGFRMQGAQASKNENLMTALALRSLLFQSTEDWPRTLEDCNELLAAGIEGKDKHDVLSRRARALFKMEEYSRTIEDCDSAMQIDGDHGESLAYMKSSSLMLSGRSEEALDYLNDVVDSGTVEKRMNDFIILRVYALADLGRYDDALAELRAVIDTGQNLDTAYSIRCGVYEVLGEDEKGIDDANKAIELGEETEHVYMNRAVCLQRLGRMDEAQKDWERAAELAPHSDLQPFFKGLAYAHGRNYSDAVACWRQGMDVNERYKGTIQKDHEALQRLRVACDAAKSAKSDSSVYLVSGWLYLLVGDTDSAVRDLTKAADLDAGSTEAKRLLNRAKGAKKGGVIEENGKLRLGRVS